MVLPYSSDLADDELPDMTSLDYVVEEMRHRELVQDAQREALSQKAISLFTGGVAAAGLTVALGGYVDRLPTEKESGGRVFLYAAGLLAGISLFFLSYSFYRAYFLHSWKRAPEPSVLWSWVTNDEKVTKADVTDGRRYAIEVNAVRLRKQAKWIRTELVFLILLIFSLLYLLAALAVPWPKEK